MYVGIYYRVHYNSSTEGELFFKKNVFVSVF